MWSFKREMQAIYRDMYWYSTKHAIILMVVVGECGEYSKAYPFSPYMNRQQLGMSAWSDEWICKWEPKPARPSKPLVQRWDYDYESMIMRLWESLILETLCHCVGGLAVDHVGGHRKAPRATLIFLIVGVMAFEGMGGSFCQAKANLRQFLQEAFIDFTKSASSKAVWRFVVKRRKLLQAWGAAMAMCCGLIACFCTIFWPAVVAFWVSWQEWCVWGAVSL